MFFEFLTIVRIGVSLAIKHGFAAFFSLVLLLGLSSDRLPLITADSSFQQWRVVESQPSGLPCRWNSEFSLPEVRDSLPFEEWAIERRLTWGQRFRSQPHEGETFFYDNQGSPWLFVPFSTLSGKSQGCLVPFKDTSVEAISQ